MDGLVQPTEIQVIPGHRASRRSVPSLRDRRGCARQLVLQWAGAGEAFFEGAIATNLDRGVYYADPVASSRDLRELGS